MRRRLGGAHALRAEDPFRRYKQEPTHEMRKQEVVGNRQEAVRRTREMLRSMTVEQLLQVVEFVPQELDLFEALALAQRENKLIVPNDILDRILAGITDTELLKKLYKGPTWTGTLVIYEAPDKKFGKQVTFTFEYQKNVKSSFSFKIPKQFQGLRNCALAIEHPDFEIVEISKKPSMWSRIFGRNRPQIENQYEIKLVEGANITLIENFPKESDKWYSPHQQTKVPQGEPVEESNEARNFRRIDGVYIGLLSHSVFIICGFGGLVAILNEKQYVRADEMPYFDCVLTSVSFANL